jgi:hypothetical protein
LVLVNEKPVDAVLASASPWGGGEADLHRSSRPLGVHGSRAAEGRVAWVDPSGELVLVDKRESSTWHLYRAGALLIGTTPATGGCLA